MPYNHVEKYVYVVLIPVSSWFYTQERKSAIKHPIAQKKIFRQPVRNMASVWILSRQQINAPRFYFYVGILMREIFNQLGLQIKQTKLLN